MSDNAQPVRLIDTAEREHRGPPPPILVIALLVIGGLIGWGAASLGGDSIATVVPATDPSDASPLGDAALPPDSRPDITWVQATDVPGIPGPLEYAGSTNVVAAGGTLYLVIRFVDPATMQISNELWSSVDGVEWESAIVDVGMEVEITELTAVSDGLLLTGVSPSLFGLWRSIPDRAIDGTSWSRVSLEIPAAFSPDFHVTATNREGEIVTAVIGQVDIWRDVVAPYLPDGIDSADPSLNLVAGVLYSPGEAPQPLFAEAPEVVTTDDTIWIRLVTRKGEEVLQTYPLPAGAYAVTAAPDLGNIPVALSWISDNSIDFSPIIGRNALPAGYFLPAGWQDGFISAAYELESAFAPDEVVPLWSTASGRAWQLADIQPPRECSPFFFATSRDRILLTAQDGTRCVGDENSEWMVLVDPSTVSYAVGGGAGFLGYPDSFDYETASFSRDGMLWVDVSIPAAEPYPTLAILEDRLFAMSVSCCDPTRSKHIDIWIGVIG